MRKFAICLFLSALSLGAQDQPLITVLPFQSIAVSEDIAAIVATLVETNLSKTGAYVLLDQTARDRLLAAAGVVPEACAEADCAVKIGAAVAADQVLLGSVAVLDNKYILNAKVVDVASSKILAADSVSAPNAEELENACVRLAGLLVQKVMPGFGVAQVEEPARTSEQPAEGATESGTADKPLVAEKAADPREAGYSDSDSSAEGDTPTVVEEQDSPREEKDTERKKIPPQLQAPLLMGSGILLLEMGNFAGSLGSAFLQRFLDDRNEYISGGSSDAALLEEYQKQHTRYLVSSISAYSLWALGAASMSTSLFLSPEAALTEKGRLLFALGSGFIVGGNILDLMAGNQNYHNRELAADYLAAGADHDQLYKDYTWGHTWYVTSRLLSYTFWGVGGAAMAWALLLDGDRQPVVVGRWNRILMTAGTAFIAAGSSTHMLAVNSLDARDETWRIYQEATDGFDSKFSAYQKAHRRYAAFTYLSYGFWALGGAGVITALYVPLGADSASDGGELSVSIVPLPNGIHLDLTLHGRK